MALELGGGRRLICCPQPALIGRDSYEGDATPALYETMEGAAADSDTPVLLWLPGAGQLPENELLRRLANALHGVGARMVLTSAAYADAAATLDQLHTAGAVVRARVKVGVRVKVRVRVRVKVLAHLARVRPCIGLVLSHLADQR